MKLLVNSVTRGDRFPKLSAEKSLSFVSSIFKPFSLDPNWRPVPHKASALHRACKQGKSTVEFPELLFASRSFTLAPNSSNWEGQVALCPVQALAPMAGWPYHTAGMLVKGGMCISTQRGRLCVNRRLVFCRNLYISLFQGIPIFWMDHTKCLCATEIVVALSLLFMSF